MRLRLEEIMKKHLVITTLLLALVFSLSACGKEKGTPGESIFTPTPTVAASNSQAQVLAELHPIKDIVTIGKYSGVEVTPLNLVVTDAEVELELYLSLKEHVADTDRKEVKKYDLANIDFEGKKDGVAFNGGTAEGYDLFIGSGNFIPGFEDGLIGVTVGETVDLPLTFPETYGNADLAGQDVVFTVTVNSIKELPEITDAFIAEKTDFETVDAYKEDIRKTLQSSYDATIDSQFETDVIAAIVADATFHMDLSQEVDTYAANMKAMYESYASMYGISLDVYISAMFGMSLSAFNAELPKSADQIVKGYYAMLAVADAENITVSDAEYQEYATQMMTDYGYQSIDAMEADYPRKNLENSILYEHALNFVMENAIRK